MRPAVRMSALAKLQSIYVFTHDSFYVGEDGPTHQPTEHLAAARVIPGLNVIRPADADETIEAWLCALENTAGPTMLILTRQDVMPINRANPLSNFSKGAYIIRDTKGKADVIIMASGSEVYDSIKAAEILEEEGINVRVVSFPSWYMFDKQDKKYKDSIMESGVPVVVVEAGSRLGWERYAGNSALYLTIDEFGKSAPAEVLAEYFGMNPKAISEKIKNWLG
jgi:transketolase